mmetsp:Transcript_14764/g.47778  ORF Transcript_14764/g.47778 Transcript_14764/m.47778 type:complete len:339 (+) Transcript_14764:64-1080(+)
MISGRDVLRECTLRGLVLRADAMRFIEHSALLSSPTDIVVLMDAIVVRLDNKIERVVDKAVVIAALDTLSSPQSSSTIRSLDAWSTPRLVYDAANKTFAFKYDGATTRSMAQWTAPKYSHPMKHGSAVARADAFCARFELCWQRTARSPLLTHRLEEDIFSSGDSAWASNLDTLRSIADGMRRCILGTLTNIEGELLYLEDAHSVVKLDISQAETFGGYFAVGMVILAEGAMDANKAMFVVDALGHPPAEPRDLALRTVGGEHMDVFENSCLVSCDVSHKLPWIIMCSCYLDSPATLPRLRLLLSRLVLPMCQRYSSTTDFQDSRGKLCVGFRAIVTQ